ncbi:MAG: class I SAM-dependent methyltransferase [Acidimicrobiales bacterium]|nr:class I SAM-dependent methyltransferase [Acidimicrobiales bacterium]
MDGYETSSYGDGLAEVYDEWFANVGDLDAVVELVSQLASSGNGSVMELGVGTGRIALPLAARGLSVLGIDGSELMLERLAQKDPGATVERLHGDFSVISLPQRKFEVAFVAFNTLFNLVEPGAQARCFQSVSAHLSASGSFLIEAFVPDPAGPKATIEPRTIALDRVVLSASKSDPNAQEVMGQYIDISSDGIVMRPWQIRWSTPEQLDEMASDAGLVLSERWEDWSRSPFSETSPTHLSRYQLA